MATSHKNANLIGKSVERRHACDECRKRKLKCSGELTGCYKCLRFKRLCRYSERHQLGRPPKKRKVDTENPNEIQKLDESVSSSTDYSVASNLASLTSFGYPKSNVGQSPDQAFNASLLPEIPLDSSDSCLFNPSTGQDMSTPNLSPAWDFTEQEQSMGPRNPTNPSINTSSVGDESTGSACPCLPNLYLALSMLSELSLSPFTPYAVQTLDSIHHKLHDAIYCSNCAQKFSTGSSNLLLICAVLNALAAQWDRLKKSSTDDLRRAFSTPQDQTGFVTTKQGQQWRAFGKDLLQAYVSGSCSVPNPPNLKLLEPDSTFESDQKRVSIPLMSLADALTRRQRQWHGLDELSDEFPDRVASDLEKSYTINRDEHAPVEHTCLKMIDFSRSVIRNLCHK